MLVTSVDPLKIFIYKEGMARFATQEYDLSQPDNYENLFMHLTNYAINKKSGNYHSGHQEGYKRPMSGIFERIRKDGHDADAIWREI